MARAKANEVQETQAERKWIVSLKFQPTTEVTAADEAGAIEAYKAVNGILQTDHKYACQPVE